MIMRFLYKLLNKPIYRICKFNDRDIYYVQRRGDFFGWKMVWINDETKIGESDRSVAYCWSEYKIVYFTDELCVAEQRISQLRRLDFKKKAKKKYSVVLKEYGKDSEEVAKLKYLEKLK